MTDDRLPPEDPRLLELALRVTDDSPVDWESSRQTAGDLGDTLEWLRRLQTLGELHRRAGVTAAAEKPLFTWGPLRAIEQIGEGGFGEVWRAWDPSLQREVALKLRRPGQDPAGASRWLREAQRLARVRHPHVLTVHGTDVHDGRAGIWTDLVRGRTLEQQLFEQGPFGARELVAIGLDLCAALAAVHGAGLVHGDIKSRNVMREGVALGAAAEARAGAAAGAGRIVLMDFGTASEQTTAGAGASAPGATPLFAAPELLEGLPPSAASDLYALGVLLYRLSSGRFPVEAGSLQELRERHRNREHASLRTWRPDLPGALVQIIERALDPDPARRFRDAAEMERSLETVFAPPAQATRAAATRGRGIALLAIGAAIMGLVWVGATWGPGWFRPRFRVVPRGAPVVTRLVQTVEGTEVAGYLGMTLASRGDLDGDGLPDLIVGAPGEASGQAHVFRGRADGTFAPWFRLSAPHAGYFGSRVGALGDVCGDGRPVFSVSASNEDCDGRIQAGAVYLYRGGASADTVPVLRIPGGRASGAFGFDVATAGDVNHDGYADFLIGAVLDPTDGATAGRAFLYLGGPTLRAAPDLVLRTTSEGGQFGYAVGGVGDINGDGFDDFAVGANSDQTVGRGSGKVCVYFGAAHPDADPDLTLYAAGEGDWFGVAVAALGDLDGDGFGDFAVGAERASGYDAWGGTVSVFFGGQNPPVKPRLVLRGGGENGKFAHRVAGGVDVNGDGYPDVVVGAYGADDNGPWNGDAYVYFGGPAMDAIADIRLAGPAKHGNFGYDLLTIPAGNGLPARIVAGAFDTRPGGGFHVFAFERPRP